MVRRRDAARRVPGADEDERPRFLLQVVSKILGARDRCRLVDVGLAEHLPGRAPRDLDRLRVVDQRRIAGGQLELQLAAGRPGDGAQHLLDPFAQL